jgi:hypothetical protein
LDNRRGGGRKGAALNVPPEPDGTDEVEAEGHPLAGTSNTAIPTLYLFGPPTSFDGWGECPSDETAITAALLVIVSLGALALTICIALGLILSDAPRELTQPNRFPIPAGLIISFAVGPAVHKVHHALDAARGTVGLGVQVLLSSLLMATRANATAAATCPSQP